jgi:nitroreductase
MEAMEAIFTRRSIRRYTWEPLSESVLRELLEAAMAAPSAGNQQPWHFIVIDDRATLDRVLTFHPHAQMLREAPAAILVCGDEKLEMYRGYWIQDCSAATQNLLLAAHAKGLGAVWLGIHPRPERVAGMRALMGLPDSIHPLALVALGYPAEKKGRAERYDSSRVRRNHW